MIKSRIAMAKNEFNKRRNLFSKRTSKDMKMNEIKTIVWSVALYGSETWTLRKYKLLKCGHGALWRISAGRIKGPTNMC